MQNIILLVRNKLFQLVVIFTASLVMLGAQPHAAYAQYSYDESDIRQNTALNSDFHYVVLANGTPSLSAFSLSGWSWWDYVQICDRYGNAFYGAYLSDLANSPWCTQVIHNSDGKLTL